MTATNSAPAGEAFAESNSVKVSAREPKDTKLPQVEPVGSPAAGQTLTCSPGEWTGTNPPTFTFAWLLGGKKLATTTQTLYVEPSYEGQYLACEVTATNAEKTKVAASGQVKVRIAVPSPLALPEIKAEGSGPVGSRLTCIDEGKAYWTPAPSTVIKYKYKYRWFRETAEVKTRDTRKRTHGRSGRPRPFDLLQGNGDR